MTDVAEAPAVVDEKRSALVVNLLAAVLDLGAAALVGLTWLDRSAENTCSSVVNPSEWWSDSQCRSLMGGRSAVALIVFVVGIANLYLAVRRRPAPSWAWAIGAAGIVLALVAVALHGILQFSNPSGY